MSEQTSNGDRLYTPQDLADRYSVPLASIYRWNWAGTGPKTIRAGRYVRYTQASVDDFERNGGHGKGVA